MPDRYSQGDTPHVVRGVQTDYKDIFYSRPEVALVVPITLQAGYGVLGAGTVLAKNISAAGNAGKFVPYNPTTFTGVENHPGRAYLVSEGTNATNYVYVTLEDSYKFAVGDDIIIDDNVTAAENKGAITVIDRTTYPHMAKITFTTVIGGTAFTVARKAYVAVEAGGSNNYSVAVGILAKGVDTGKGQNAQGAGSGLLLSNAVLYAGLCENLDSTAVTALSVTSIGQFAVLK